MHSKLLELLMRRFALFFSTNMFRSTFSEFGHGNLISWYRLNIWISYIFCNMSPANIVYLYLFIDSSGKTYQTKSPDALKIFLFLSHFQRKRVKALPMPSLLPYPGEWICKLLAFSFTAEPTTAFAAALLPRRRRLCLAGGVVGVHTLLCGAAARG